MHRFNKKYISELDQFLAHMDAKYPRRSLSQQAFIQSYKRINMLRDNRIAQDTRPALDFFE
jgi:hypothetical protein